MIARFLVCLSIAMLLGLLQPRFAQGEPTAEQAKQIKQIEDSLQKFQSLIKTKKFQEATELLTSNGELLESLKNADNAADLAKELGSIGKRLEAAQRLLDRSEGKGGKTSGKREPKKDGFLKGVAPILVAKCGNCHIQRQQGGFSVETYGDLMKGSDAGVVFQPGKAEGSTLIEKLVTGDMPRGGGKLPEAEIDLIAKWIDAGAKFDGDDEKALLADLVPKVEAPARPVVPVIQGSEGDAVQFTRDLAPLVVQHCFSCHAAMRPAGNLNLATFESILRGSRDNVIITPGKPEESQLIRKLRGTAGGGRMPLNADPLPDDVIAKFATWIADGAKFDGDSAARPLDVAVQMYVAARMSHDELSAKRVELANANWKLANPEMKAEVILGERLLLVGRLGPARMQEFTKLATSVQSKVAAQLKVPEKGVFLKGKLTLYAFDRRYEYSEYVRMVEKREIPDDWTNHWRYSVLDAYGCIVLPKGDLDDAAPQMAETIAGCYVESLGSVPAWFSLGSARVIASRAIPKGEQVKKWETEIREAALRTDKPDGFLNASLLSGDSRALAFGFTKFLAGKQGKYQNLLKELKAGTAFDTAFRKQFGADAKTLAANWLVTAATAKK